MSKAKELLKAGLGNKSLSLTAVHSEAPESDLNEKNVVQPSQFAGPDDLGMVLLNREVPSDKLVKRTFEMRESHVEVLNKIVKRAKNNGKKITQSDALQFVISNWSDRLGNEYID